MQCRDLWIRLMLAATVVFVVVVRLRLESLPLERDEGEYAYAGQLILEGIPPYQLAYNMKLPGTYLAYAGIIALFGQTTEGIHRGLLVINVAAVLLVFSIARRLFDDIAGLTAAAAYGVLSLGPSVGGIAAHATHFVVLPVLLGVRLSLRDGRCTPWNALGTGVLFGLGFLMKQPGALFVPLGALLVTRRAWQASEGRVGRVTRQLVCFSAGALVPYALTCLWLWHEGVFQQFWFWTVEYASQYASIATVADGIRAFRSGIGEVASRALPLWVLAALGLSAPWWSRRARAQWTVLASLAFFSFLAVCPGLYFREHYFIVLLPAVAVLAGVAISSVHFELLQRGSRTTAALAAGALALGCVGYPVAAQASSFFMTSPVALSRELYGENPFVESPEIARFIARHTAADSTIAVIGSEPQIYFYARRHSATGYIYTYGLMERQPFAVQMQREMIREIEAAKPEYLVMVSIPSSWLLRPDSHMEIFSWARRYCREHYELSGRVDRVNGGESEYHWGDAAVPDPGGTGGGLTIWKRRKGG